MQLRVHRSPRRLLGDEAMTIFYWIGGIVLVLGGIYLVARWIGDYLWDNVEH